MNHRGSDIKKKKYIYINNLECIPMNTGISLYLLDTSSYIFIRQTLILSM